MDRVRLGRALGYGARHAAKAMAQAVDAATTPSSSGAAGQGQASKGQPQRIPARQNTAQQASTQQASTQQASTQQASTQRASRPTVKQVRTHARAAGRSAWAPVARFSSVLWLQVTGTFFALIAAVLGQGLWVRRALLRPGAGSHEAQKLYVLVVVFALFAYFAVSNFVRAARRERR